jgi:hypothetical protein
MSGEIFDEGLCAIHPENLACRWGTAKSSPAGRGNKPWQFIALGAVGAGF